jgi:hypothetical protein
MHRKIGAAVVAIALFIGTTTVSFAENTGGASSPASGRDSSGRDIGNTSSTHNPRPSSPSLLEWRIESRAKRVLTLPRIIHVVENRGDRSA